VNEIPEAQLLFHAPKLAPLLAGWSMDERAASITSHGLNTHSRLLQELSYQLTF
jgi:hypothetical protein